ncbi:MULTISPECIES: ferredoxin--NADP reductase [unclassified Carboxylicivirga]|uniref:ferredoxin--NADP reductase n=1 Tax=Carboxylicivirga TaxID=1628153 RepID=UPI003D3495F8
MKTQKRRTLKATKVISNTVLNDGVHCIKLERNFNFQAGQVIALALHTDDEPRLYSIASGQNDPYLSILFDVKPMGELTPPLSQIEAGQTVYRSDPFGKFLCQEKPATWIATGTGIAPFIALAKSGMANDITLLHGARTLDKFYFQDYFEQELGENYLRFCTTESSEKVNSGRLTNYLQTAENLPTNNKYYLCGGSEMVIDVREILIARGVPFDNIVAEIYF